MISKKPYYKPEMSPAMQFVTFLGITLALLFAGSILALSLIYGLYGPATFRLIMEMNLSAPQVTSALWLLQIMGTTLPILLTPIVFGWLIMRQPQAYLQTNVRFPVILLLIVFSVMVISTPIMEVLINLNRNMDLPDFLQGVEDWMRRSEQSAQQATEALLQMKTLGDMIQSLLLVGLVTAIAEELMFRGCLQTIFVRWTQNTHVAIWITAALFSAFHLEFFGFLPRLMLGVFFGYFAAWSGSVWPAVWAHFINNGAAVIMTYLYQHKKINIDPNEEHAFNYSLYILSILITVALLWSYRNAALQRNNHHHQRH